MLLTIMLLLILLNIQLAFTIVIACVHHAAFERCMSILLTSEEFTEVKINE